MSESKEMKFISIIKESLPEKDQDFIGDDCAVLEVNLLVSMDAMVEGVHFFREANPYDIGWKLSAVNISDIASMGGDPKYLTVAASLRKDCSEEYFKDLLEGILDCCKKYNVSLVGGDLTAADKTYLSATIIGRSSHDGIAKRNAALVGHKIIATGSFGCSGAGLWALQNNNTSGAESLIAKHLRPMPRIDEGIEIVRLSGGDLSMMDASDGLLDCLTQISQQSGVKLCIDFEKIPLSNDLQSFAEKNNLDLAKLVLIGGEDFELVATVPKEIDLPLGWTVIGEVTEGEGVCITKVGALLNLDDFVSYEHFQKAKI